MYPDLSYGTPRSIENARTIAFGARRCARWEMGGLEGQLLLVFLSDGSPPILALSLVPMGATRMWCIKFVSVLLCRRALLGLGMDGCRACD